MTTALFCLSSCSSRNPVDTTEKSKQVAVSETATPTGTFSSSQSASLTGSKSQQPAAAAPTDLIHRVSVTVGPFDIHRKYRSMEGPYVTEAVKVSDWLDKKSISVGEDHIQFVENGQQTSMAASASRVKPPAASASEPRELVWLTGVHLVVLDEHDRELPTSEFMCHCNVDLNRRDEIFPEIHTGSNRLFTITQGQSDIHFPAGCAVPLASNEYIYLKFQAANRTTTAHRRIKHLCTVDLIRDSDLKTPMKALSWYTPFMAVELNGSTKLAASSLHGPGCLSLSTGENAPNAIPGTVIDYAAGRKVTGHWKVPPGRHFYVCPLTKERDFGFNSEDRIVRSVWTHCHPLCKQVTMLVCDGSKKTPVWTVDVSTNTDSGLETSKISDLNFTEGVLLPKGKQFEIDAIYDNTTGVAQDSMVSQGIFFEDPKFVKPNWSDQTLSPSKDPAQCTDLYCGVKPTDRSTPAGNSTEAGKKH